MMVFRRRLFGKIFMNVFTETAPFPAHMNVTRTSLVYAEIALNGADV
jgi:hypothetical protein